MKNLISVIIPFYNSEKYIRSCIDSVLIQTYPDFELILVDDGSEDSSADICEMLCKRDNRITLIKQIHKGVSAARNLGIETSNGKYLFFLDSDDMIHPQLLEALYHLQESEQTVISTGKLYCLKEKEFPGTVDWKKEDSNIQKSLYLENKEVIDHIKKPVICGIRGKMILRKAIKSIRFYETLGYSEDILFLYQLLLSGADMSVLCCNWYCYRIRESSLSRDFSISACQERYRVERYICSSEKKSGRKENAVLREWDILGIITEWYETGRIHKNVGLMNYAKKLAKNQTKLKIFHQLGLGRKLYFYQVIYCYPVSVLFKRISLVLPRFIKRFFYPQSKELE